MSRRLSRQARLEVTSVVPRNDTSFSQRGSAQFDACRHRELPRRYWRDDIVKNAMVLDCSLGLNALVTGKEKEAIKATPNKRWFTYFNRYRPTPFFDCK